MGSLWLDIRQALRTFRANPGLTAVAVLSLAVGLGPNAAIFSAIDAVGFRPLPIRDASHLVVVGNRSPGTRSGALSYTEYRDIRQLTHAFSGVAASAMQGFAVSGGQQPPTLAMGSVVTANYFAVLGLAPMLGRTFGSDEEGDRGVQPAALISERLWTERFNRDPRIVGQTVRLNRTDVPIVGVVAGTFTGTDPIPIFALDVWVPVGLMSTLAPGAAARLEARDERNMTVFGRLRPGTTLEQANAEVQALGANLVKQYPTADRRFQLVAAYEEAIRRTLPTMLMAFALPIVGLVLLIACANVAGLLLGRSQARRNEVAVRLALGASRRRLIRQLLTESGVLSVAGACLGLLVTFWVLRALRALIPAGPLPIAFVPRLDPRVLLFTLAAAVFAVPVFGLTPALLASRPDILPLLKGVGGQPTARRRVTLRGVLVVGQISVALALLVCSGLLTRSYWNARNIEPGFAPRPMAMATVVPGAVGYGKSQTREFYATLVDRLDSAPGVERAALSRHMPLNALYGSGFRRKISVPGQAVTAANDTLAFRYNTVTPRYFDTMGLPILRGRDFTASDRAGSSNVVIVNQTLARQLGGTDQVVGRHVVLMPDPMDATTRDCEIIGVVRDAKYVTLTEPGEGYFYLPYAQMAGDEMTVIARGRDERLLASTLRREVAAIDRAVPVTQVTTLSEQLRTASITEQVEATLVTGVGALGLFLSMIGLYGVVSFMVARRTRDIGVRMALGAQPADVVVEVLRQAGRYAVIGGGIGLVLAAGAARVMRSSLYGVSIADPLVFGGSALLLVVVALAASYLPARRAARIDPLRAIRWE